MKPPKDKIRSVISEGKHARHGAIMTDLSKYAREVITRGDVLTDKEVLAMADELDRLFQNLCDVRADLCFACQHLHRWLDWCEGPADPHPLDSIREVKAFLDRINKQEYAASSS